MRKKTPKRLSSFNLEPGTVLGDKYEILSLLGKGWEGEVYQVRELGLDIIRAAKFFLPHRNPANRTLRFYARKLHKLRHCPILIQYHTREKVLIDEIPVTFLVSEYVEGELLSDFLKTQPGKRLTPFEGMHLLHALASGVESIHMSREYHGDLHTDNVIIGRRGLSFDVKLVDMFNWGPATAQSIRDDVSDLIRILYDSLGGARHYSRQPQVVKEVCCGLKRSLIESKFRTAGELREYLENLTWE